MTHEFKPNAGCPCDLCLRQQKRWDYGVFLQQATEAGIWDGGNGIYFWWDKIAAWVKEDLPRYSCAAHGRYSDMLPACPKCIVPRKVTDDDPRPNL